MIKKSLMSIWFEKPKALVLISKMINFRVDKVLIAFCLFFLFSGCATLIHGTKETIYVESEPTGAKIINQNKELGETPRAIKISRKTKGILLKKENYKPYKIELNPEFNFTKEWLTNFGLSGLSGGIFFTPIGSLLTQKGLLEPLFLLWAGWLLVGGLIIGPVVDGATGAAYDFNLPNNNIHITLEETDSLKFEIAKKSNSIEAYEKFLVSVPETSFYAARARKILDTLMFYRAIAANTAKSYREYLVSYPAGAFAKEAKDSLEILLWREAESARSLAAYRNYLAEFPSGKFVKEAIARAVELLIERPKDKDYSVREGVAKVLVKFADDENLSGEIKSFIKSICTYCNTLGTVECECKGSGYIYLYSRDFGGGYVEHYYEECPYCNKTGRIVCPKCGGTGFLK